MAALRMTERLLRRNAGVVTEYLESVIPAVLDIVSDGKEKSEKSEKLDLEKPVRQLLGLKVLKTMTDLPLASVFKYTGGVARGLLPLLDDDQRVIREYAARVRNLWLMIHYRCLLTNRPIWVAKGS